MVKFGRHVDFFVANELDPARRLYVVPYKDVQHKTCIEIPKAAVAPPPPPPAPATPLPSVEIVSPLCSPPLSRACSRGGTPQPQPLHHPNQYYQQDHEQDHDQPLQQRKTQPPPQRPASGLSLLFVDNSNPPSLTNSPSIKPKHKNKNLNGLFASASPPPPLTDVDVIVKPKAMKAVATHTAVTLNAGTGAELASAVKHLLISQRKAQTSNVAQVVPDDYCYDDPCNTEQATNLVEQATNKAITSEEDKEAQANFFAQRFKMEWRICLKRASDDFDRAMQLFWTEVFEGITSYNDQQNNDPEEKEQSSDYEDAIRGALPDAALQIYVLAVSRKRVQNTFSFLKDIHATALINAEALRKLVKKFDKIHYKLDNHSYLLSAKLLPEVYASNFTGSLASLEAGLALLRVLMNIDDDGDDDSLASFADDDKEAPKAIRDENRRLKKLATMDEDLRDVAVLSGGYFGNKKDTDAELVKRRKEELQWLRSMVEGIDPVYIPFLVGHRGFHSIHDRSDVRPLENSQMAYEAAWTNGVHLCECDIALTKDERIILAHDENFYRLGMDPNSPLCNRTVRDLTFKELMNCPLKSGARPPLLFDVLRSAAAIGGDAKMIVEIKAGNTEAGSALARMFVRHPQLMEHVAVVMSFDAFIMHNFRREMAAVFEQLHSTHQAPTAIAHAHHKMSSAALQIPHDNVQNVHPLKAPVLSNIALGSTLSSSPNLGPSIMSHHSRAPSHGRFPSRLGGHNRLDSRDMFGLGHPLPQGDQIYMQQQKSLADLGLGLNLADIDINPTTSSSTTFLPIQKSSNNLHQQLLQHSSQQEGNLAEAKDDPHDNANNQNIIHSFPKLLLITVAETPKADYELFVDMTKPDKVAKLDGWLRGGDGGSLDGVYMQYQKSMLGPEGSKAMRNLASRYDVGIWGANPIPDDWETFHSLVTECHVSYVNSSLPKHFRRKMKRSMSANTVAMNAILANQSYDHL